MILTLLVILVVITLSDSFSTEIQGSRGETPLNEHTIDYNRVYFTTDALRKVAQVAKIKGERGLKSIRLNVRILQAIAFIIAKDPRYGTFTDFVEDWCYKGVVTVLHNLGDNDARQHLQDLTIIKAYDSKVRREAIKQFRSVEIPQLISEALMSVGMGDKITAYQIDEDLRSARPMCVDDTGLLAQIDNALERLATIL